MRSFLKRFSQCAPALVLVSAASAAAMSPWSSPVVLDPKNPDINNEYARFGFSFTDPQSNLSTLLLDIKYPPASEVLPASVTISSQAVDLTWKFKSTEALDGANTNAPEWPEIWSSLGEWIANTPTTDHTLLLEDAEGITHQVQMSAMVVLTKERERGGTLVENGILQQMIFDIKSIDHAKLNYGVSFILDLSSVPQRRFLRIVPHETTTIVPFEKHASASVDTQPLDGASTVDFDLEAEVESLLLLEAEAGELMTKIAAKKCAIGNHLRQHREHLTLKHLLQQCDGVMCAAKVIAQRICDKVGISTEPSFKYVAVQNQLTQHPVGAAQDSSDSQHDAKNCSKSKFFQLFAIGSEKSSEQTAHVPLLSDKFAPGTTAEVDFSTPADALIKVLEIIAGALGLVALFSFLHRKLMPMRKRVERDADREERRNARAYRRAARRAEMRLRWDAFVRSINCFRSPDEPRNDNYDDKRALILQDAFLEQEIEHAEKGEVMEAEIRELRYAHELVTNMVRNGERRPDFIPVADPPPPLVPLPFTPISRSRASSGTLPSYTSELLPDYTSRVDVDISSAGRASSSSSSVVDGFPHYSSSSASSSSEEEPSSHTQSTAPSEVGSRRSRYTALSSLIDTSPRISEETLRTRQSKDTRYSREL